MMLNKTSAILQGNLLYPWMRCQSPAALPVAYCIKEEGITKASKELFRNGQNIQFVCTLWGCNIFPKKQIFSVNWHTSLSISKLSPPNKDFQEMKAGVAFRPFLKRSLTKATANQVYAGCSTIKFILFWTYFEL